MEKIKLDVGCGNFKKSGYIGMDARETRCTDIVWDAENMPWNPIADGECSHVYMGHIIEHIKPWLQIDTMNECWRVLETGGRLKIVTPYGMSYFYYQDPTHCSPWVEDTVEYFIPGNPLYQVYTPKPWKKISMNFDTRGMLDIELEKLSG
jgi:predicted SAM-dependent methyltransferase